MCSPKAMGKWEFGELQKQRNLYWGRRAEPRCGEALGQSPGAFLGERTVHPGDRAGVQGPGWAGHCCLWLASPISSLLLETASVTSVFMYRAGKLPTDIRISASTQFLIASPLSSLKFMALVVGKRNGILQKSELFVSCFHLQIADFFFFNQVPSK